LSRCFPLKIDAPADQVISFHCELNKNPQKYTYLDEHENMRLLLDPVPESSLRKENNMLKTSDQKVRYKNIKQHLHLSF